MKQYDMKTYDTISEAYLGTLADVLDNPDYVCAPRGLEIYEKVNYLFQILHPIAEPIVTKDIERNKVIVDYTQKELALYNSGSNKVEDFEKASKFWAKLTNPDGTTINSAYGNLIWQKKSQGNQEFEGVMRTPWEYAKQCLINDKDSRQAIMAFSLPEHRWIPNKDQVCTIYGNWLIRDDKLNLFIAMRSNDVTLGICYDIVFFVSLIDRMVEELKPYYPNLSKGSYTHMANSYHAYCKDFPKINKMLGR